MQKKILSTSFATESHTFKNEPIFSLVFLCCQHPKEAFLVAFYILHQSQSPAELGLSHIFITQRQRLHVDLGQPIPVPTFLFTCILLSIHTGVDHSNILASCNICSTFFTLMRPHCPCLHLHYNFPLCSIVSAFSFCIQHLPPQTLSLHSLFNFCVFVCCQAKAYNFQQVLSWYLCLHCQLNGILKHIKIQLSLQSSLSK